MANTNCDNRAAEIFMDLHLPLFESVLTNAARDEARWNRRVETLETLGLLDFQTDSGLKLKSVLDQFADDQKGERVYVLPAKELDQPILKRRLMRKLKVHRPSSWTRHRLRLDRDQIFDDKYRRDIAKVLTYKWAFSLELGNIDDLQAMKLVKFTKLMDVSALEQCLDTFRLNDLCAESINSLLLRRLTNELLDGNDKLQARLSLAGAKMAFVQEKAVEDVQVQCQKILPEFKRALGDILSETNGEFDAAIAANRERAADDDALYAKTLAERAQRDSEDTEESFRRAVDRRLSRSKATRKRWARMLRRRHPAAFAFWAASRLTLFAVPLLLAFHLKVGTNGITLVNSICRLLNWEC